MSSVFRNLLAGLSPREKKMVGAMGVIFVLMVCFLTAWLVGGAITELEQNTVEWSELTSFVQNMEAAFEQNKQSNSQMDALGKPRPLRTLVDNVVKKSGVAQVDTKELNDKSWPGGWLERSAEVTFQQVDLEGIVNFMKEVENNRRTFPIAITRLKITKQRRVEGMFRVAMTISTYEKTEELAGPQKGEKKK